MEFAVEWELYKKDCDVAEIPSKPKTYYEWYLYYVNKNQSFEDAIPLALEQAYKHSAKEKYCAYCGTTKNITLKPASCWIHAEYYSCKKCEKRAS